MNNCIINDVFTEFLNILQKCKNTIISDNDYDHCLNIINKLIIEKDLILISKIRQITINKKIIGLDKIYKMCIIILLKIRYTHYKK